ncbi:MAG: Mth938-like domain-containing protein [Acidimicrobiia bacterium]
MSTSPPVGDHGWGFVEVEGIGRLRDAKLWPGGGRAWDWNETGTHHRPGIQPADVLELLDHAPEVVVLSRGRQLRLETCGETLSLLESRGVEVIRQETGAAMDAYNRLVAEDRRAAALFHTAC